MNVVCGVIKVHFLMVLAALATRPACTVTNHNDIYKRLLLCLISSLLWPCFGAGVWKIGRVLLCAVK